MSGAEDFLGNIFLLIIYCGAFALALIMCMGFLGFLGLLGLALRGVKWIWRWAHGKA